MKKFFFICVVLISALKGWGQDPNFSQFFSSPLTLNPALTGKFDGQYRVAGNYRNQWPTIYNAYVTSTMSVDMSVLKNRISDIDQMGVGILAYSDKAGDGALKSTYGGLSLAYHKGIDENAMHQIGAGFQTVFVNKRLDVTNLKFQDQLTPLGFTGVTSEVFLQDQLNVNYVDVNAGVIYNGSTNGYNNFYLGASMYHINRPKESFKGANFLLNPRTTLQAGGKVPLANYNAFHFAASHSTQAGAHNTMIGGAISINTNNDDIDPTNFYVGSWVRFGDAVIPYIGLEFKGMRFGASYDINVSSLKPASNARGGIEISLIYIKKHVDPNMKFLNCPKF